MLYGTYDDQNRELDYCGGGGFEWSVGVVFPLEEEDLKYITDIAITATDLELAMLKNKFAGLFEGQSGVTQARFTGTFALTIAYYLSRITRPLGSAWRKK